MPEEAIFVKPFEWQDWRSLWELRLQQLAEHGIVLDLDVIPSQPAAVGREDHEWDFHRIAEVYLSGAGNFWLAWRGNAPVGYVGGQDLGRTVELRRMYVRAEDRRHGVGTRLVRALIEHSVAHDVRAIELWTAENGPGRVLYQKMGFLETEGPGEEFKDVAALTGYSPAPSEIRMRLAL